MYYVVSYGNSQFKTVNKALAVKMANRHSGKITKVISGLGKAPTTPNKK